MKLEPRISTPIILAVTLFALLQSGCLATTREINSDVATELWGDCGSDIEYSTVIDLFLVETRSRPDEPRLAISPPQSYPMAAKIHTTPSSIELYKQNPTRNVLVSLPGFQTYVTVEGVIEAGTRLRCSTLELTEGISIWYGRTNDITRYMEIINGPHAGKLADVEDLGEYCCEVDGFMVKNFNTELIRREN